VGDLSGWAEALAEVSRAKDALAQGEGDVALHNRVATVRDELERGQGEARRRAVDAEAERQLISRLEAIRGEHGEHFNPRHADRAFAEAFRAFGVDLDEYDPRQAAAKLAGRPGTAEIAGALDEWCLLRRVNLARRRASGRGAGWPR
jgi:hypothetical protein